jgi:hypothetical protein
MEPGAEAADLDVLFRLLSESRRRRMLYYFLDGDCANVETLARWIAAWEADEALESVSSEAVERRTVSLVHNHLPRLAEHGFVRYDHRSGDVAVDDAFEAARPTLERAAAIEGREPVAESVPHTDPVAESATDDR